MVEENVLERAADAIEIHGCRKNHCTLSLLFQRALNTLL
jgi:hypothetical protein